MSSRRLPKDWTPEKGTPRTKKPHAATEHEPVTIERLERALAFCAILVVRDGPILVPLFESLERDLAEMRAQQASIERAKALLESYRPPREDVPRLNHMADLTLVPADALQKVVAR